MILLTDFPSAGQGAFPVCRVPRFAGKRPKTLYIVSPAPRGTQYPVSGLPAIYHMPCFPLSAGNTLSSLRIPDRRTGAGRRSTLTAPPAHISVIIAQKIFTFKAFICKKWPGCCGRRGNAAGHLREPSGFSLHPGPDCGKLDAERRECGKPWKKTGTVCSSTGNAALQSCRS